MGLPSLGSVLTDIGENIKAGANDLISKIGNVFKGPGTTQSNNSVVTPTQAQRQSTVMTYQDNLNEATNIMIEKKISEQKFDQTISCKIIDDSEASKGKYIVENDSTSSFEAFSNLTEDLAVGDYVYVLIPGGDWTEQKRIVCKKTDENADVLEETSYLTPFSTFVDITGNLVNDNLSSSILANSNSVKSVAIATDKDISFLKDISKEQYTRLGIAAKFKTRFLNRVIKEGGYGLKFSLSGKRLNPNAEGEIEFKEYYEINNDNIVGNPYEFPVEIRQEQVFDISGIQSITKIEISLYQNSNFKDSSGQLLTYTKNLDKVDIAEQDFEILSDAANILVSDIYISLGYSTQELNAEKIYITTLNGTEKYNVANIKGKNDIETKQLIEENNTKTINFKWIHQSKPGIFESVNERTRGIEYSLRWYLKDDGESGDAYSGQGWKILGIQGYGKQDPNDETAKNTLFYQSLEENILKNINFFTITFLTDITKLTQMIKAVLVYEDSSYSTNLLTFTNDQNIRNEKNSIEASIADKLFIACMGNKNSSIDTSRITNEDEQQFTAWEEIDDSYFLYPEAYDDTNKHQEDLRALRDQERYFCICLGYSDNGKPRLLSPGLVQETDSINNPSAYKCIEKIDWILPIKNTMLSFSDINSTGTALKVIKNTYNHTKANDEISANVTGQIQPYSLASIYNETYLNNTIVCNVTIDGIEYSITKTLSFGKSGSMGTDYSIDIKMYYGGKEVNALLWDNQTDKSNTIDKPVELKVEVRQDGKLIDLSPYKDGITWELLPQPIGLQASIIAQEQEYLDFILNETLNPIEKEIADKTEEKDLKTIEGTTQRLIQLLIAQRNQKSSNTSLDSQIQTLLTRREGQINNYEYNYGKKYMPLNLSNAIRFNFLVDVKDNSSGLITLLENAKKVQEKNWNVEIEDIETQLKDLTEKSQTISQLLQEYVNGKIELKELLSEKEIAALGDDKIDLYKQFITLERPETFAIQLSPQTKPNTNIDEKTLLNDGWVGDEYIQIGLPIGLKDTSGNARLTEGIFRNNFNVIQVSISSLVNGMVLKAQKGIPVKTSAKYDFIEGPTEIVYDSYGACKDYSSLPYQIYEGNQPIEASQIAYWDIVNSKQAYGEFNSKIIDTLEETDERQKYFPTLKKTKLSDDEYQYNLQPVSFFIAEGANYNCLVCYTKDSIAWSQPLVIKQEKYFSNTLNKWNSEEQPLVQDDETGTLLAARLGAGHKNAIDNSFTGVVLGDWKADNNTQTLSGLYGFSHNDQTFGFREDGTAFIGKSSGGRILFDGNSSTIKSANFKDTTSGGGGTLLDLDDGFLIFRAPGETSQTLIPEEKSRKIILNSKADNETTFPFAIGESFKVKWDGKFYATNAEISGKIIAEQGTIGGCEIDEKGRLHIQNALIVSGKDSSLTGADIISAEDLKEIFSGNINEKYQDQFSTITLDKGATKVEILKGVTNDLTALANLEISYDPKVGALHWDSDNAENINKFFTTISGFTINDSGLTSSYTKNKITYWNYLSNNGKSGNNLTAVALGLGGVMAGAYSKINNKPDDDLGWQLSSTLKDNGSSDLTDFYWPFVVTKEGKLYATGAEISGKITAKSGNIGGCEINNGILDISKLEAITNISGDIEKHAKALKKLDLNDNKSALNQRIAKEIENVKLTDAQKEQLESIAGIESSSIDGALDKLAKCFGVNKEIFTGSDLQSTYSALNNRFSLRQKAKRDADGNIVKDSNGNIVYEIADTIFDTGEQDVINFYFSSLGGFSTTKTELSSVYVWKGKNNHLYNQYNLINNYQDPDGIQRDDDILMGLGGWSENDKKQYTTDYDTSRDGWKKMGTVAGKEDAYWPFLITKKGKLYATGAEISGKIITDEGKIGNWDLINRQLSASYVVDSENETVLHYSRWYTPDYRYFTPDASLSADEKQTAMENYIRREIIFGLNGANSDESNVGWWQVIDGNQMLNVYKATGTTSQGAKIECKIDIWPFAITGYGDVYGIKFHSKYALDVASDARLKKDICTLDSQEQKYDTFFDDLRPKTFKYNYMHDKNPTIQFGFIAQDIKKEFQRLDLNPFDYGILNQPDKYYTLTYDNFIALNTWQIQKLKKSVKELTEEINKLKREKGEQ